MDESCIHITNFLEKNYKTSKYKNKLTNKIYPYIPVILFPSVFLFTFINFLVVVGDRCDWARIPAI